MGNLTDNQLEQARLQSIDQLSAHVAELEAQLKGERSRAWRELLQAQIAAAEQRLEAALAGMEVWLMHLEAERDADAPPAQ